jgi:seryl-tRNA synthetase
MARAGGAAVESRLNRTLRNQMTQTFAPSLIDGNDESLPEDALARLAALCERQRELESGIGALEMELKEKAAALKKVSEEDVPALFDELGVKEIRLSDGTRVEVKEDVRVSTTGKNRDPINLWLDKNGHGDLIKDVVSASFGKGETRDAGELAAELRERGLSVDRQRAVNAGSYAALLRELKAAGDDVPWDKIGAYWQRWTKLTR